MNSNSFFIIAHNIRSLYNVGSVFRTSDALGIDKIYLTGYTGTPKNLRLAKTALGAEKTVEWEYRLRLKPLLNELKRSEIAIVGLENNLPLTLTLSPLPRGEEKGVLTALDKFKPKFPLALLLGEEVKGINKKYLRFCDKIVEIPQVGKKESLNVAVAFGIAAYVINAKCKYQNEK